MNSDGLVMKIHSRFYFATFLMLILLLNGACGKKSDLTLPAESRSHPSNNIEKSE
jgi:predicted small lipoprotein YifL